MGEPLHFVHGRTMPLRDIVTLTGAVLVDAGADSSSAREIRGISALDRAGPDDIVFIDNVRYAADLAGTHAGACLTSERFAAQVPPHIPRLMVSDPYRAFVEVARALFPSALRPSSLFEAGGISAGASVHASVRMEHGVSVDPAAVIGPRAEIGAGTVIGAAAVIGAGVRIGRDCAIGAGATLSHAIVGDRVIIHPGCHIGQDGFGYTRGPGGHLKVPQVGRVIIQNDVEIGAGTAIDRGGNRDTMIGEGTKIDNLVQVGHNVCIGRHCIIVAQTGISGSVTLEDFVVLGARVGINNHVTIGEGAQIAAISVVNGDVPPRARWGGTPARPVKQWFREMVALERLGARPPAEQTKGGMDE